MLEKELYCKVLEIYGLDSQLDMLQEECAELIQACSKYKRYESKEKIAEEIADVTIMMEQIIQFLDISEGVELFKRFKLGRLEKRLGNKSNGQEWKENK